jgi:hypothetical protein
MKKNFGLLCDHVTLCQFLYVDNVFLTQITKLELSYVIADSIPRKLDFFVGEEPMEDWGYGTPYMSLISLLA